jgi:hypothetical protein
MNLLWLILLLELNVDHEGGPEVGGEVLYVCFYYAFNLTDNVECIYCVQYDALKCIYIEEWLNLADYQCLHT